MTYDPRACGAQCDECPLNGGRVIAPYIPARLRSGYPALVFVSDAPGTQELQTDKTFGGYINDKLNELLGPVGSTTYHTHLTHVILCRPEVPDQLGSRRFDLKVYQAWFRRENIRRKKGKQPQLKSPFECCRPRFVAELLEADINAYSRGAPNGVVVLPLTNIALQHVMSLEKKQTPTSIMKYRGSVIPIDYSKQQTETEIDKESRP